MIGAPALYFFFKAKEPCGDCIDGWCTMNCSPREPDESQTENDLQKVQRGKDD